MKRSFAPATFSMVALVELTPCAAAVFAAEKLDLAAIGEASGARF